MTRTSSEGDGDGRAAGHGTQRPYRGDSGRISGYGYRRLGRQLRREGVVVNEKRIHRAQRRYQLHPVRWEF